MLQDWRSRQPAVVRTFPTRNELFEALAARLLELVEATQKGGGIFSMIVGGGRSPAKLNHVLIEQAPRFRLDRSRILIFFSDERCVPPGHPDSNFRLIRETLVEPLGIPMKNAVRIRGEWRPERAAAEYHRKIAACGFSIGTGCRVFDLALLGLGSDGHTASLFPGSSTLEESELLAATAGTGPEGWPRVTVTLPVLNSAKHIWLMGYGREKSVAVEHLLTGEYHPRRWPAQAIHPKSGSPVYWLDREAANALESTGR